MIGSGFPVGVAVAVDADAEFAKVVKVFFDDGVPEAQGAVHAFFPLSSSFSFSSMFSYFRAFSVF